MNFKKLIFLFLIFISIGFVSSLSYEETSSGVSYYVSDYEIRAPSLNVRDLIILEPSVRPSNPVSGMIYFDRASGKLNFYDGASWKIISFEGVSSGVIEKDIVVEREVAPEEEKIEENISSDLNESVSGDFFNDSSVASEILSENDSQIESENREEVTIICEEVCSDECTTEEVCSDVETCEEVCLTNEVGEEVCSDECTTEEVCSDVETCEEICNEECSLPEQLFDIRMNLESSVISNSSELAVFITFESFGTVPTPVNLTFDIYDSNNNLIYSKNDSLIVEIEEVFREDFVDFVYPAGKYELVFSTLYNVDVRDEFRQKFEIIELSFWKKILRWIGFN